MNVDQHQNEKEYKVCKGECGRELEICEDNFNPHHLSKDGFMNTCRECRKKETNSNITQKGNPQEKDIITEKPEPPINHLDLTEAISHYPEIFEELKNQAEDRVRPIEYHALWLMKVAMDAEPMNIQEIVNTLLKRKGEQDDNRVFKS